MSKEISPKGAQYRYPKLSSVGRFFRVLRDVTFKKDEEEFFEGAKKTREKKKREYWEKKKKTKKKEERKSRVLYVCVCVVVVALNRLGEKLQDFFQRGDERVHVLFGVVDVETGASAAENVQVSVQRLRAVVAASTADAVELVEQSANVRTIDAVDVECG